MVEDTLKRSTADEGMCPALTLGLYTTAEQSGILEDKTSCRMMLYILRKYLNRWHATPNKWKRKKVNEITEGVEEGKFAILITIPGEIGGFLKASGIDHNIVPPTFFFKWIMQEEQAKKRVVDSLSQISLPLWTWRVSFLPHHYQSKERA